MTLTRLRAEAVGPGMFGRTVLLLALVGAVLVGLLAMHTIASEMPGNHNASMSVGMQSHGSVEGSLPGGPATADCGGTCDPDHVMSGTSCVLALLFTGVMLFALASRRWPLSLSKLPLFAVPTGYVDRLPWPPDLTELSISRT